MIFPIIQARNEDKPEPVNPEQGSMPAADGKAKVLGDHDRAHLYVEVASLSFGGLGELWLAGCLNSPVTQQDGEMPTLLSCERHPDFAFDISFGQL
jgi:hypothetical protein